MIYGTLIQNDDMIIVRGCFEYIKVDMYVIEEFR